MEIFTLKKALFPQVHNEGDHLPNSPKALDADTNSGLNPHGWYTLLALLMASYIALRPALSFAVQSAVILLAGLLRQTENLEPAIIESESLPVDRVYLSVFLRVLSNISVVGLAVAGQPGEALHTMLPELFASPALIAEGVTVSAVVASGSSTLPVIIARLGARMALVVAGAILSQSAMRIQEPWFFGFHPPVLRWRFLLGLVLLAEGVAGLGIITCTLPTADLETAGLPLIATKIIVIPPSMYSTVAEPLGRFMLLNASLMAALFVTLLAGQPWKYFSRKDLMERNDNNPLDFRSIVTTRRGPRFRSATLFVLVIALGVSPVRSIGSGQVIMASPVTEYITTKVDSYNSEVDSYIADASKELQQPASLDIPFLPAPLQHKSPQTPSITYIAGGEYIHTFIVNGTPQIIRGVGYNPEYSALPEIERSRLYGRDFRQITAAGFNSILGWKQREFDELTLSRANEYGLGVMLPFDLPANANYSDTVTTGQLTQEVTAWVNRYKNAPALRMWAIGNEVLHDMKDKSQAPAFARYYAELVQLVHTLDPAHPVLYRDAEDSFVGILRQAFKDVGTKRSWLIYGMNIFTYRMDTALAKWPSQGLDVALLLSEYAPTGVPRHARPGAYLRMWTSARKEPGMVLGGFAYVWSTNGPEALDRTYGLVNENGEPTDGSLAALTSLNWREIEANNGKGEP